MDKKPVYFFCPKCAKPFRGDSREQALTNLSTHFVGVHPDEAAKSDIVINKATVLVVNKPQNVPVIDTEEKDPGVA